MIISRMPLEKKQKQKKHALETCVAINLPLILWNSFTSSSRV